MVDELQIRIYTEKDLFLFEEEFSVELNQLDVYYQVGFLCADAHMQKGKAEVFTLTNTESNEYVIYPYIRIPIQDTKNEDISSPYGYAGPVASSQSILDSMEVLFLKYAQEQGFVTEFVRYHYNYNEEIQFKNKCKNLPNRTVVYLNSELDYDTIWMNQFSTTNRNLVRKLKKENYTWHIKPFELSDISEFKSVYDETMSYLQADAFYGFSEEFYQELSLGLGNKIQVCWVEKEGETYAKSLVFISGGIVTYFLSGRNLNYPKVSATNLLLSELSAWASEKNEKLVNFGGGLSLSREDRLFKFKQNFSKTEKTFYIGKRIHSEQAYTELINAYIEKNGLEKFESVKHILQFYQH